MVDIEEVEDCGVEIVYMDMIFYGFVFKVVGFVKDEF